MKYIKYFEDNEDEVARICKQYRIKNWELRDGLVDVYGGVDLSYEGLTKLPLNFGYVSGYFNCSRNQLTTLEGCPKEVSGSFYCYSNKLTTLKGCPNEVGGHFWCDDNKLTTLEFAPLKVSGIIYWYNNPLPEEILEITNQEMKRLFLYFHQDYTLWKNGEFVKWKFEDLMDEINEYLEKHPNGIKFN